jgi:hypothetical protein
VLLLAAFSYVNRDRLFVRDPRGSVTRNGVAEDGAQVFINHNNDVLLENDHPPMYFNLLQHNQPVSAPESLKCIHFLVCLASGDAVPQTTVQPDAHLESMTAQQVQFKDGEGRQVLVRLR